MTLLCVGLTLLSLLALGVSLAHHIGQHARAEYLVGVIRAQRRRLDLMEAELRGTSRTGTTCGGKRDSPRRRGRQADLDRGGFPLSGLRRNYPIDPSSN
jgi:hypothetical protein